MFEFLYLFFHFDIIINIHIFAQVHSLVKCKEKQIMQHWWVSICFFQCCSIHTTMISLLLRIQVLITISVTWFCPYIYTNFLDCVAFDLALSLSSLTNVENKDKMIACRAKSWKTK